MNLRPKDEPIRLSGVEPATRRCDRCATPVGYILCDECRDAMGYEGCGRAVELLAGSLRERVKERDSARAEAAELNGKLGARLGELSEARDQVVRLGQELESLRTHAEEGLRLAYGSADERLGWVQSLVRATLGHWNGGASHRQQVTEAVARIEQLEDVHLKSEQPARVPRVWRKGDFEPVEAGLTLRDSAGDDWVRSPGGWRVTRWQDGSIPLEHQLPDPWYAVLTFEPLTEVLDVPAPAEAPYRHANGQPCFGCQSCFAATFGDGEGAPEPESGVPAPAEQTAERADDCQGCGSQPRVRVHHKGLPEVMVDAEEMPAPAEGGEPNG